MNMSMAMATAPTWVTIAGWVITWTGFFVAAMMIVDIYVRGYRQPVRAMEAVWPITAVYSGPLALWAYHKWGRPLTAKWQEQHQRSPQWGVAVTAATQTIAGGAASFIGHTLAVPLVMWTGWTIAGKHVWAMILLIAVFALPLLIAFEYRSLADLIPSTARRLQMAVRISVLAILAFDLGMGAIMLLVAFVLHYGPTTAAFWLLMWVGMWLGFATAYPMVWRLLARNATELVEATQAADPSRTG